MYRNYKSDPSYNHIFKYQLIYNYNYYIKLLNNKEVQRDKHFYNNQLIEFIDMFSSEKLSNTNEFIILKEEYNKILLKDKCKIHDECKICYENNDVYNGFYNCTHNICINCYDQWTGSCPICRTSVSNIYIRI